MYKGILVGTFNEDDLKNGRDKAEVEKAQKEHNLNYTNTELIKKGKEIVGIQIWVCDADTFTL